MSQAWFDEALSHHRAGRLAEAEHLYRRILVAAPGHADSLHLLGVIARQVGRPDIAIELIGQAITADATRAAFHFSLGLALHDLGRVDEAVAGFRRAAEIAPDDAEAHCNLGSALFGLGRLAEAEASFRRALAIRPDLAPAHANLGGTLSGLGRLAESEASCRRALEIFPDGADAHGNLGKTLGDLGRLEEAEAHCRRALEIKPDYAEAHCTLGSVLFDLGRLAEAEVSCRRALEIRPDFAQARNNLGIAVLAAGDFVEGWREYEWRWQAPHLRAFRRDFAQPQWQGEAGGGRALLIHAEQGFGDTLQFCRYAPLAAARGWRVIVEVQKPLVRLMGGLAGAEQVVAAGEPLPDFDVHCPMLSLPLALGTTLDTIPADIFYLRADESQVAAWKQRLAARPERGLRIGLAWAGNPRPHAPHLQAIDRRRSLPADRLMPLAEVAGLDFFSLQKGGTPAPAGFPLTDVMDEMADFADTAALIANLDLVISVDTAVAHLAAALGRPVWLLNRFDSCWRWLRDRDDSPWYPTLRQFRQPRPGDWSAVVEAVRAELGRGRPG